jgi:hypothetical protein
MARSEVISDSPKVNSTNWKLMTEEEKEQLFREKNDITKRSNGTNNKARQSYMAQPNVKAFNKEFVPKALTGRPYKWNSLEELEGEITDYFDLCERTDTVPTVTALCGWLHCSRDTFYSHANNSNSPFSDTLKNVLTICHSFLENGTIDGKINPVTFIFLGKNYFGLKDDKNITVTPTSDKSQINTQETMSAIQKQIEEESVPNADYVEK